MSTLKAWERFVIIFHPPFKNENIELPEGHWEVFVTIGNELDSPHMYLGGSGSLDGAMRFIADHQVKPRDR
jgi:hypothetical protein